MIYIKYKSVLLNIKLIKIDVKNKLKFYSMIILFKM